MNERKSRLSVTFTSLRAFLATLLIASVCFPVMSESAGPWKGQVVDKDTGKSLEGAVVLARWEKRYTSFVGEMGGNEYYDSEEVVTDAEGRFVISARQTWTVNPFSEIYGPEFFIFKAGYGRWQFRDFDKWWKQDPERERAERERFTADGALLELPPLKTEQERREFSGHMPLGMPAVRMPKYLEELNRNRQSLGLQPVNPK